MNMKSKMTYGQKDKGIIPIVMMIAIFVAIAAAAGAGYYFSKSAKPGAPAKEVGAGKADVTQPVSGQAGDDIDSLQISAPSFGAPSTSALPSLQASAFNLSSASLPSNGIFRDFTAKTDTSYSYKLDIAVPTVELDVPTAPAAPSGGSTGSSGGSTGGSSGSGGSQSTPSASNCAQFLAMPSAQYCSAAGDPNGIALCQACKAAGY
jgi:hypothetical protein